MNIHLPAMTWGSLGTRVLTHPHVFPMKISGAPNLPDLSGSRLHLWLFEVPRLPRQRVYGALPPAPAGGAWVVGGRSFGSLAFWRSGQTWLYLIFFFAKTRINPWFLFSFPIKKKRNGFWVHSHYNFLLVSHGNFWGSPFFGQTLSGLTSFSTTVAHVALQPRNTGKHSTNFRSLSKFNQLFGWLMLRPHHDVSINDGLIEGICPNMCSYQQFFRQLND